MQSSAFRFFKYKYDESHFKGFSFLSAESYHFVAAFLLCLFKLLFTQCPRDSARTIRRSYTQVRPAYPPRAITIAGSARSTLGTRRCHSHRPSQTGAEYRFATTCATNRQSLTPAPLHQLARTEVACRSSLRVCPATRRTLQRLPPGGPPARSPRACRSRCGGTSCRAWATP